MMMVRPAGRNIAQSNDRRAQIAAEASQLFAEYGYETTSVRQIADRVGMLAGSLYNHFATKEDMLHAVMRKRTQHFERSHVAIGQSPADAEARLVASAVLRIHDHIQYREFHTILLQEGGLFQRRPDFAYVVTAKANIGAMQQEILADGMGCGQFRSDIDTYLMIRTISRILSGVTMWSRSTGPNADGQLHCYSLDAMIDFHLDSMLRLIRPVNRLAEPVPREPSEALLDEVFGESEQGWRIADAEKLMFHANGR